MRASVQALLSSTGPESTSWISLIVQVRCMVGEAVRGAQGARDAALEREGALGAEKAHLKAALGAALEQKGATDCQLAAALHERAQLLAQACSAPATVCCIAALCLQTVYPMAGYVSMPWELLYAMYLCPGRW